ncbi:MAG: thiamine pyrophosphate-dependent dehydrogenase E1 component subunit alpha [Christensenellales bacterium]
MAASDVALLLEFYEIIYKTRRFDEEVFEYYKAGMMPGLIHLSFGQEAVGTGAVKALNTGDFLSVHHRCHAHFFAAGSSMKKLLCEILGKADGFCKGKGGTIHCSDMTVNAIGLTGILGSNFGIGLGPAYRFAMKKQPNISAIFTGDSATNEGCFHESLNMAKTWKLPVLYIIENNQYGMYTAIKDVTSIDCLSKRGRSYDIPGVTVDGNDAAVIYKTVKEAADYVRGGNGPMIVECMTYRTKGHHVGDPGKYKDPAEQEAWLKRCPLLRMETVLKEKDITEDELEAIRNKVESDISEAKAFAEASPYPPLEEAFTDVYSI